MGDEHPSIGSVGNIGGAMPTGGAEPGGCLRFHLVILNDTVEGAG